MVDNIRLTQAIKNIDDANFGVRKKAIQVIAKSQYVPAVPVLVRVLFDNKIEERTRALVARALGKLGTDEAFRALVAVLGEIEPTVMYQVRYRNDPTETHQLHGAMLSAAIIVALRSMNTAEARNAILEWHKGKSAKK